MSFILEALRKAEREREAHTTLKRRVLYPQDRPDQRRSWRWVVAVALILNIIILASVLLRSKSDDLSDAAQQADHATLEGGTRPTMAETKQPLPKDTGGSSNAALRDRDPQPSQGSEAQTDGGAPRTAKREKVATEAKRKNDRPPLPPATPVTHPSAASKPRLDQPTPQAPRTATRTDLEQGPEETVLASLPRFEQMPSQVQSAIPDLRLNLIAYATNPGERLVYIKNRRYLEGEIVEGAFRVEAIQRNGVVLSHRGERFLLLP